MYVLIRTDHYIDSKDVFVSLTIVVVMRFPLTTLPALFNGLVQVLETLQI